MCDACVPYSDLTDEQREQQTAALAATFVGLPTVIGAPLILADEVWREVAVHQLELGARICGDIPAIKTYTAPTPAEALEVQSAAGHWTYDADHTDVETPRERVLRKAREEREEYLAEVQRRRETGELPPLNEGDNDG
ncbi:phage gene 29 protein family protein [Gordonia alkaliphila]|uniref:Uncharacterized protein n=1 Tax=Gordonia alkaliphila TaxID=1053547 RepID=A0ABP8ZKK0_9ACTN